MKSEKGEAKDSRLIFPRINMANKNLSPRKSSHPYQWYSWKYNTTGKNEKSKINRIGQSANNDIREFSGRVNHSKSNVKRNHLVLDTQDKHSDNNRLSTSAKNYQRLVTSNIRQCQSSTFF